MNLRLNLFFFSRNGLGLLFSFHCRCNAQLIALKAIFVCSSSRHTHFGISLSLSVYDLIPFVVYMNQALCQEVFFFFISCSRFPCRLAHDVKLCTRHLRGESASCPYLLNQKGFFSFLLPLCRFPCRFAREKKKRTRYHQLLMNRLGDRSPSSSPSWQLSI